MTNIVPLRPRQIRRWRPEDTQKLGFKVKAKEEGSRGDMGGLMALAGALAPLLLFALALWATGMRL